MNVMYVDLEHRTMNRQGLYIPPLKISSRLHLDKLKGFELRYKVTCILDILQCGWKTMFRKLPVLLSSVKSFKSALNLIL
jgi:hypothetical protein